MLTSSSAESGAQCRALAGWFHERGIAWSGTSSELLSELADTDCKFAAPYQLIAFLEANSAALAELGLQVVLSKAAGRPRVIHLRSNRSVAEVSDEPPSIVPAAGGAESTSVEVGPEALAPVEARLPSADYFGPSPTEDWPGAISEQSSTRQSPEAPGASFGIFESLKAHSRSSGLRSVAVTAACLIVFAVVALLFRANAGSRLLANGRGADDTRQSGQSANSTGTATADAGAQAPALDSDISELWNQAARERNAAAQYELATRYLDGRGVIADNIAAYTWLVLALANGETRSEGVLPSLTSRLSPTDVQKVRLALGDAYANGVGVTRDFVLAHSWYSLAEVAGSAEATIQKTRLEKKMTARQIAESKTRTTAWLRRH